MNLFKSITSALSRIVISPTYNPKKIQWTARHLQQKNLHTQTVPVKEVKIPTRLGHLAGKLWGNEQDRPILALHGWQDNAGTWDPIAPIIAKGRSILAIDFPGHGLSSWYPPGTHYYPWELPRYILYIKEYFNWDKVTLLCHSMGSIAGLRFACIFPEDVDGYVAIDCLVADDYDLNLVIEKYATYLRKANIAQKRLDQEPPAYTLEDIKKVWHLGTRKSVSLESVDHLLKRGSKPSILDPTKLYFSRDPRLKYIMFNPEKNKFVEGLIARQKAPTLYIKGNDSPYANDQFSIDMRELLATTNDKFESHFLPGTHHLHLNNPELVAPLIISFLQKHNLYNQEIKNSTV